MANSPTIVSAALSDKELQESINNMVANFEKGLQKMAGMSNEYVGQIQKKLQEIGATKFDLGGSVDGGSSKQVKAQRDATEATEKRIQKEKELNLTLDQQAQALKRGFARAWKIPTSDLDLAQTKMEHLESYMKSMREKRLMSPTQIASTEAEIRKIRQMLSSTEQEQNKITQATQQTTQSAQRYTDEIRKQLQNIKEINSAKSAKTAYENVSSLPTDTIDQANAKLQALQALKEKVANTPLLSKTSQVQLTQGITDTKVKIEQLETAARGTNQTKKSLDELNAAVRQSVAEEQKRRDAILQTGVAAQETFAKIRHSTQIQLADNTDKPIMGIKELTLAIQNMERAYWGMESYNRESPLGQSLKRDIENAQKLRIAIDAFNRSIYGLSVVRGDSGADKTLGSYMELSNILKTLTDEYRRLGREERNAAKSDDLANKIQRLGRETQKIQQQMNRPINLDAALKGSEKTLDDIAYKMQRLRSYRQGIDLTKPQAANEIKQVDEALAKLQKDADKWMGKSQEMIKSNTALGRSWNYMKNRFAFYFTVGASTQFVKNLIEVRSQYEMNERALGILINSAERGSQIFNELSQMALVSPYTLIELSSAAKQLTAYDMAAKDVVDTTRRLADMASAVGIPIERLTYALGQIKAYGYLNSRDARMFANAGIPLVKQLSEYYTELEGRLVSTADVYDRIKKKAIDYNDVMQVINKMTDEGGKFFDFQAKMADTLKVRLANLTLAWNNMLNDIGKESQGVLTWGIGALRTLFLHWKDLDSLIKNAAWALGIRTAFMLIAYSALKAGAALGVTSKQMALSSVFGTRLAGVLKTVAGSLWAIAKSPLTWWSLLAVAAVEVAQAISGANEAQKALNESIRNGAKDNYENISKFLERYQEFRNSLYKTETRRGERIGSIYDPATGKEAASAYATEEVTTGVEINKNEAKKAWEAIREQIELTVTASDAYIGRLLSIEDVSERVRQGFNLLDNLQVVNAALKELDDDAIKIKKDWSVMGWHFGLLPDGLIGNLKDYQKEINNVVQKYGSVKEMMDNTFLGGKGGSDRNDYLTALERFRNDLKVTTDSIIDFIELKGWSGDESKINQVFEQITQKISQDNSLDPQKAFILQVEVEEARSEAARQALLIRINDEKAALAAARQEISDAELTEAQRRERSKTISAINADVARYNSWNETNGRSRVEWERFTKWLKEEHIAETTAMFKSMDAEDIKSLNFQEGKYNEFVTRMVTQYAKEHKMSYDEAFNYLKSWVTSANQWSLFLPLIISTEDKKSLYQTLSEADKRLQEVNKEIDRLKKIPQSSVNYYQALEDIETLKKERRELIAEDAEDEKKARRDAAAGRKAQKAAESELQKALKEELSLIDKVRSTYKTLRKEGVDDTTALKVATEGFDETVASINNRLARFGITPLDLSKFAGIRNPREIMDMLQQQLDTIMKSSAVKPSEVKDLQVKLKDLKVESVTFDQKTVTDSLNNELGKLKDEYELAVESDANPELGDMFAQMFGLDTNALPRTFGEAFDRANAIVKGKMRELNLETKDFDLMQTAIEPDKDNKWMGIAFDSDTVKEILKWQNTFRDMFKKNITETEKMLDDYVKKYGDYSDKIAEIEADRLEKLKKLNESYFTEEMRKRPEYIAKLNAIEQGAKREKQQVDFDEFKDSRYYTMMFENLDYISTKTIRDMRDRVREYIDTAKDLTPEQLKTLISQYEKLEQKLVKRSPFKTLTKDLKEYFKTSKDRKAANDEFRNTQKQYDAQKKVVAALKERREVAIATKNEDYDDFGELEEEINAQEGILKSLEEQNKEAQKKADKYNLIKKLALEEAAAVAQVVATNLQSLVELRDFMQQDLGVEFSEELNGLVDGLSKAGKGINKIISSAQGGDIVGVITGVGQTIYGLYDGIASIFGGGSAKDAKITKGIQESERAVKKLELAYKNLEDAIEDAYGTQIIGAKQAAIANKELQLVEMERQLALEKSRDSKHRDNDRIIELQGQIIDLRNEIKRSYQEITTELLGISSVGDAAMQFMDTYIEALRKGEDAQAAFTGSWKDMIANMIKQIFVTKVIGPQLEALVDEMNERITNRSKAEADAYQEAVKKQSEIQTWSDEQLRNKIFEERTGLPSTNATKYANLEIWNSITKSVVDQYRKDVEDAVIKAKKELDAATTPTIEDLDLVAQGGKDLLPLLQATDDQINELLERYDLYDKDAENKLSALQQGLQSMSESTAEALEAYANSISQQAYLRNDLLVQIRDTIQGFDMDVQLGVFSQMLLQLQTNYTVMMSMQSMMEGWTTASGQGIRVELIS